MWIDEEQLSVQQKRKIEYILKDQIMSRIKVKILNENCMPQRTHRWDAGWDLRAAQTETIPAGKTKKIHTGVIFEIPARNCGIVVPRSSLGTKHRITLANDVGIIDSEYRGEILVFLSNDSDEDYTINAGTRFAQILFVPINSSELWKVDQLSVTDRGDGGFGSTTITTNKVDCRMPSQQLIGDTVAGIEPIIKEEIKEKKVELALLTNLKLAEYIKLKNTGKLKELYPTATGNMKEDLCL